MRRPKNATQRTSDGVKLATHLNLLGDLSAEEQGDRRARAQRSPCRSVSRALTLEEPEGGPKPTFQKRLRGT
jgi:hypothetical protein